jgi:hypothetical protein
LSLSPTIMLLLPLWGLLPVAAAAALQIPFQSPDSSREIAVSPQLAAHHPLHPSRPSAAFATFETTEPVPLHLRAKPQTVYRPRIRPLSAEWERRRRRPLLWREQDADPWDPVTVEAPDVTDVETLANLAKMSSNAYTEHDNGTKHSDWIDLGGHWNWVSPRPLTMDCDSQISLTVYSSLAPSAGKTTGSVATSLRRQTTRRP